MNTLIALAHLSKDSSKRKAVLWLAQRAFFAATDVPTFWDYARPYETPLLPMYEAMVEELNAAHMSVYPNINATFGVLQGDLGALQLQPGLRQVAECSGGAALNHESIVEAAQSVLADFGPYYMLAIAVPTPKELDWIPVKIKVNRPGLTVRAAPGFLGLKSEKASKTQTAHP